MSQQVPYHSYYGEQEDESLMFATMFDLQPDDNKKILASLEGLNSGVPTRTTATLTPTHLRNIEQTFIELQCRGESAALAHAGFVPPPIAAQANNYGILNPGGYGGYGGDAMSGGSLLHVSPGPVSSSGDSSSSSAPPAPKRRNVGGRRPTKAPANISPEEEERRNVRRERNKMAAARCRKRRLDHTNELVEETEGLERRKQELQEEIRELNESCKQLQYLLESHRTVCCRLGGPPGRASPPDVKPFRLQPAPLPAAPRPAATPAPNSVSVKVETVDTLELTMGLNSDIFMSPQAKQRTMLSEANTQVVTSSCALESPGALNTPPATRAPRPSFLHVPSFPFTPGQLHAIKNGTAPDLGIDISTPSSSLPFNFDSLMDGGTGLTPVQACATQQHKSHPEILSPESAQTNKLVSL